MNKISLTLIMLFVIVLSSNAYEIPVTDEKLVGYISDLLITEYDKFKDRTSMEKFVLKLGRKAYIDSINEWKKNFSNLKGMKIKLHPTIEKIVEKGNNYLTVTEALRFRYLFEHLTYLGFENLNVFYTSTKNYYIKYGYKVLTIDLINEAVSETEYYNIKMKLYEDEEDTKDEIRVFFKDKRLKYKLAFYSFAFEFLDKIRVDIIKKDMETMKKKIDEKNGKS